MVWDRPLNLLVIWEWTVINELNVIMKNRKLIVVVIFIVASVLLVSLFGGLLGAGSYVYSQKYEFNIGRTELINKIEKVKEGNVELNVPSEIELLDGYDDNLNYHFYIYYNNNIIHCFVSGDTTTIKSTIYFHAINKGLSIGNWKEVNRDYDRDENLQVKEQFAERFLKKLHLNYVDRGNSMFIFWK